MTYYNVIKRDGSSVRFDISKISAAITKAFDACGIPHDASVIELLALRATADFAPQVQNNTVGVETIQDSVERVLSETGYADVAKTYILYRKQR